jgi:hypothetical protein
MSSGSPWAGAPVFALDSSQTDIHELVESTTGIQRPASNDRHPVGILSVASWTARNRASITPRAHRLAILRGDAQVAQLVEHVTENHGVGGSIPPLGTILK